MYTRFPPEREDALMPWSANFSLKINASPTTYSLTAAQASAYQALHDDFVTKWNTANDQSTRTPVSVELKNVAKRSLIANARLLGGVVQRAPGTTNAMRLDLGLPERDFEPTSIPAPSQAPLIEVVSTTTNIAKVKLINTLEPTRRGKPFGVDGASVFSHVGATPPTGSTGWKFEGNITRTKFSIVFDAGIIPGTTVWLSAQWFNPRKETGPAATPVSANLPGAATVLVA